MPQGYLMLVLHNHLPYVRHPEHEEFLEERWFFEAVLESYLPVLYILEKLHEDGVDYSITLSFSPTLLSMFDDELLQKRFVRHLEKLMELGEKEVERTINLPEQPLARMYRDKIRKIHDYYTERCRGNIINLLKDLNSTGRVELITCPATHGFLPFMREEAVDAQIDTGLKTFERFLGFKPAGMWLPECGYLPGLEKILKKHDIRYFFLDTHGIIHADPPNFMGGAYSPVQCPNGVIAFGRDPESSKQVWSKDEGYPGDYDYREYYRDIGFDLPMNYIKPYIHPDGIRLNTGFKYHRITGKTEHKELYNPDAAKEKAAIHAGNFMFNRQKQIEYLCSIMDRKPLVVAPYDGELFGHWWYEGPIWLDMLLRKIHFDQDEVKTITPTGYLSMYSKNHIAQPSMSSWGDKGYFEVWLNGSNDWIYRHLHKAADFMVELADTHKNAEGFLRTALQQAARELLLAQASDWAFMMTAGSMVEYARKRTIDHLGRFFKLYRDIKDKTLDKVWLNVVMSKDNVFPDIDYRIYSSHGSEAAQKVLSAWS